jgi:hypothetical protein
MIDGGNSEQSAGQPQASEPKITKLPDAGPEVMWKSATAGGKKEPISLSTVSLKRRGDASVRSTTGSMNSYGDEGLVPNGGVSTSKVEPFDSDAKDPNER